MATGRLRQSRLTAYLLSGGVTEPVEALSTEAAPAEVAIDPQSGIDGAFYYEARPVTPAGWVRFVQPALSTQLEDAHSASSAAVLFVKTSNRMVAFTFGFGRSLLDLTKIERQFGLRVALNRIHPDQIRSLDTKTFEDVVVTKRVQTSRSSELPSFGVDIARDIVRAVTGQPEDRGFATRLAGSDALVLNLAASVSDLPKKCEELVEAFQDTKYRDNFGWIDHLLIVSNPDLIGKLDALLEERLSARDTTGAHLAMPEPLDWQDIEAFRLAPGGNREYEDLDLGAYLEDAIERDKGVSSRLLKQRRVQVKFLRASEWEARWTIYDCLVAEQLLNGELFVLIEGRWFRVNQSLVDEVEQFLTSMPAARLSLPPSAHHETEGDYNKRVAAASDGLLVSLDAKIRRPGGASSGIEICDLLSRDGTFIHVKRKSRSSTLSHLFAQGSVSALTFVRDSSFRDKLRELVQAELKKPDAMWADLLADGEVDRARFSVSYAVITDSTKPGHEWLPFFSRLNLMQHGRQVSGLNLAVSLQRVGFQNGA